MPVTPTKLPTPGFPEDPDVFIARVEKDHRKLLRTESMHPTQLSALYADESAPEMESLSDSNSDPEDVEQDEEQQPLRVHEYPDLADYFNQWPELGHAQRIKIARAYAALLSAQMPPKVAAAGNKRQKK